MYEPAQARNAHGHHAKAVLYGNHRDTHFVRACADEMHMDISIEHPACLNTLTPSARSPVARVFLGKNGINWNHCNIWTFSMYVYIYIYICVYTPCKYIYIYTYVALVQTHDELRIHICTL